MEKEIIFLILGAFGGYLGAMIQHSLELRRSRISEIRQEKIKIYSNVLYELSGLFIDPEKYSDNLKDSNYIFKFSNRLGRILGPARLIASNKLENKLRALYDDEVAWHKYMAQGKNSEESDRLGDIATKTRMETEQEMRKELKK